MFFKNGYYLYSRIVKDGVSASGDCIFALLSTQKVKGGLLLKDKKGDSLKLKYDGGNSPDTVHLFLHYTQQLFGDKITNRERMQDPVLAQRIISYLKKYYGERHTNCSTLVEYLMTGEFSECDLSKESFAYLGGMNRYAGQPIRPGDALCIFFYKKGVASSRKVPTDIRRHYLQTKKKILQTKGGLGHLRKRGTAHYTSEELIRGYGLGLYSDYHFMYCIGIHNGLPVFIQQMGRNEPGEQMDIKKSPIVISVGNANVTKEAHPAIMFIKKGGG